MKILPKLLAVLMSMAILTGVVSVSPNTLAATENPSPDMIYLDPDDCRDLVPGANTITKGENGAFSYTCDAVGATIRWYFDAELASQYPYVIVSTKSFPSGGWCMIPQWGDKLFATNLGATSNRIHPSMNYVVLDRRLETFVPDYTGLQFVFEGVAVGTKIEFEYIALSKVDPTETVMLDPDNCQDIKPAAGTITKGENGAFTYTAPEAGGGGMRWYFNAADAAAYRYIIISVKSFPAGSWCLLPQWGDKFFAANLSESSNRIHPGSDQVVLDKQAEDFSGAGYNGFQMFFEGVAAGTVVEFNYIAVSKIPNPSIPVEEEEITPDALVFDAATEVAEVVPPAGSIVTGTKKAFNFTVAPQDANTSWNAFRLYKGSVDLSVYKYLILSINDLPQGEVQAVLNDVVLNNDYINYNDQNKTVSIDVSAYNLTGTGAVRLTLYTSGVASGQTVKYNYVALSNMTAEQLKTAEYDIGGGVVDDDAEEPEDPEDPEDPDPSDEKIVMDFKDAIVDSNVIAKATNDGFTMKIDPEQTFSYQNIGGVSFKVKADLSKLKYLHIDLKENKQAYFLYFFLDNEDGSAHLDNMAYPAYVIAGTNPGHLNYSVYDDILAKGEGYQAYVTGERWYTIAVCMDDGGSKNGEINTFGAIYLDNNKDWKLVEDDDDDDDDDDDIPDTSDRTVAALPILLMVVSGVIISKKTRRIFY